MSHTCSKNYSPRRRALALVCVSLILSLSVGISLPGLAGASKASDLKKKQKKAAELAKKAAAEEKDVKKLKKEIKNLDEQATEYSKQADALDPQIDKATAKTKALVEDLRVLQAQQNELSSQIASTTAEYSRQQELLGARMAESYKLGDNFYLEMLLSSSDFTDLLTRIEYVNRAMSANANLSDDLESTKIQLRVDKEELTVVVDAAAAKRREAANAESSLRTLQSNREQAAANAQAIEDQKTTLMKDKKSNANRLRALAEEEEAEAAKIARELGGSYTGSGIYTGKMTWPVPASHRVSSPFGPRICPFHGRENHSGIDISSGGKYPPIVAAGGGTVIHAGWRGGYGNTVIINHGNGVTTLYAHMSSISVSNGSAVSGGQKIGNVGSTGFSTGPHLHWEVRVNGTPKNPMSY